MTACSVTWCAALPLSRDPLGRCVVHAIDAEIHPEPLAANEEWDGSFARCEECGLRRFDRRSGEWVETHGDCKDCRGSGECGEECGHGHSCGHDCETCSGTGRCHACRGTGWAGVRIKTTEAA